MKMFSMIVTSSMIFLQMNAWHTVKAYRLDQKEKNYGLLQSIIDGNGEQVRALINKGADVNCQDDGGKTPLHYASFLENKPKNKDLVALLMRHGAKLNVKDKEGQTPLDYTLRNGSLNALTDYTTNSTLPADITFLIADIKYAPGKLKILEFGEGNYAGFKVLDHMRRVGLIWEQLWPVLFAHGIPVFLVGSEPGRNPSKVALTKFTSLGGVYETSLLNLSKNNYFKKVCARPLLNDLTTIKNHKGIIVVKIRGISSKAIEKLKNQYPGFIILNLATRDCLGDKHLTTLLFNNERLAQYRPKSNVYPRIYTPTLAQQIVQDLNNPSIVVIKPVNSSKGNGILMVPKTKLDQVLQLILQKYNNNLEYDNTYTYKPDKLMTYSYWKYDRNSHFVVEEYVESKHIFVRGKEYDPTMRVIFTLQNDGGKFLINFFDAYWKRPIKALSDKGTFREKRISKHAPNYYQSIGYKVSPQDLQEVYAMLEEAMRDVYKNMLFTYSNGVD